MTTPDDLTDSDGTQPEPEVVKRSEEGSDEVDRSRRGDRTKRILDEAAKRDASATARDAVADERARLADRAAFASPDGVYPGHGERLAAAGDRADAKTDRESSAVDRAQLTEEVGGDAH